MLISAPSTYNLGGDKYKRAQPAKQQMLTEQQIQQKSN